MSSPTGADVLSRARAGGYAVGAFNAVNLETAQAVVSAAEAERAPVIVQFSENAARHGGLEALYGIGRGLAAKATVPVLVHFDHAESVVSAKRAVDLGFDSVMLESVETQGAGYARELRGLSDHAHQRGAFVEGEFEVVKKGGRQGEASTIDSLAELVNASGCDWVCVAIGSEHKMTDKTAALDLDRLERIAAVVERPLVLHGSSGVKDDELRQAVALGIAKVNLATGLIGAFTEAVRSELGADLGLNDPRRYLAAGREAMFQRVREYLRLLGSSGRAD